MKTRHGTEGVKFRFTSIIQHSSSALPFRHVFINIAHSTPARLGSSLSASFSIPVHQFVLYCNGVE
ncbi:hypothetical protein E2C01_078122 [Portunus trituberculatus]|uniref:Uncharacterized protein n=1 Tax=Portunus trituberculatus TaxID=210409 RepID=A0A5B7ILT5_PORTR|nr:hypothetical protein [Portunus trituberculatus]